MRLGIGSYTYTWAIGVPGYPPRQPLTAHGLLARAARLGVHVVQFADNLPLDELPAHARTELRRAADALEIAVEVGTRGITPDHLRRNLAVACEFGAPFLRVVIDKADHHPPPEEVVRLLRTVMPEFEAANVTLALENHDRFKVATLLGIIRQVGSARLGVCLDTVNSFGALEGPDAVVEALGPYTVNLHVKDFAVQRAGHNLGFTVEGRPAGQGQLDVPWLLARLAEFGRDCNAILELWTPPTGDVEATIALEARWAEASVAYLRTLIEK